MKRQKPNHRIPWWCFDSIYRKPLKGWWKIWERRKERRFGTLQIKESSDDK